MMMFFSEVCLLMMCLIEELVSTNTILCVYLWRCLAFTRNLSSPPHPTTNFWMKYIPSLNIVHNKYYYQCPLWDTHRRIEPNWPCHKFFDLITLDERTLKIYLISYSINVRFIIEYGSLDLINFDFSVSLFVLSLSVWHGFLKYLCQVKFLIKKNMYVYRKW